MVHEIHAGDQGKHAGKKPGHEQHAEEKTQNHERHEGMKHEGHEQHEGMKHEQHEEMKHQGHEMSGGKDHGDHHSHMLADFRKRFIVSFILTFPVLLLSPTIQSFSDLGSVFLVPITSPFCCLQSFISMEVIRFSRA